MYLSVNCSGENYINRLHRNFLSLPYTRNQHSSYTISSDGKLSFDNIGVVAGFSWFSLGVMIYFSFVFFRAFAGYKTSFNNKHITILAVIFFIFGVCINYANYHYVIEPNGMVECPAKVGYKKNLMRDYVTDISLCKKF